MFAWMVVVAVCGIAAVAAIACDEYSHEFKLIIFRKLISTLASYSS